jgi:hypothetical protein
MVAGVVSSLVLGEVPWYYAAMRFYRVSHSLFCESSWLCFALAASGSRSRRNDAKIPVKLTKGLSGITGPITYMAMSISMLQGPAHSGFQTCFKAVAWLSTQLSVDARWLVGVMAIMAPG